MARETALDNEGVVHVEKMSRPAPAIERGSGRVGCGDRQGEIDRDAAGDGEQRSIALHAAPVSSASRDGRVPRA